MHIHTCLLRTTPVTNLPTPRLQQNRQPAFLVCARRFFSGKRRPSLLLCVPNFSQISTSIGHLLYRSDRSLKMVDEEDTFRYTARESSTATTSRGDQKTLRLWST